MASLEQKIAAEVLRERGKKLLKVEEVEKNKKQLEAERLYFWILNRMEWEMEKSDIPKRDIRLAIEEKQPGGKNGEMIFSYNGNTGEEYRTKYVFGKDINDVLIRVKCTIGSIHGYSAYVIQPHNNTQRASMMVMLAL